MIEHVKIENLNGKYNYDLTFNRDINIITGRNGAGKTTLMKLLWAAVSDNFGVMQECVQSSIKTKYSVFDTELLYDGKYINYPHSTIFLPTFRRIEGGFNYLLGDIFQQIKKADYSRREMLFYGQKPKHILVFSVGTFDITVLIKSKYADISAQIRNLEEAQNKFTTELIHKRNGSDADTIFKKIEDKINETNEKKNILLNPFTVLGELVAQFLNKTTPLTYPELIDNIDSEQLSAGEKQMLSFLSYCIFYENTIIFIDEPELSLHVDWQRLFIPTLIKLNTSNQYFLATHSPFIYANYPDKEIILDDNKGGE